MTKLAIKYIACEGGIVKPVTSIVVTKSVDLFLFAKFRNDCLVCSLIPGDRLCSPDMALPSLFSLPSRFVSSN